jgi:hypothetical protein
MRKIEARKRREAKEEVRKVKCPTIIAGYFSISGSASYSDSIFNRIKKSPHPSALLVHLYFCKQLPFSGAILLR